MSNNKFLYGLIAGALASTFGNIIYNNQRDDLLNRDDIEACEVSKNRLDSNRYLGAVIDVFDNNRGAAKVDSNGQYSCKIKGKGESYYTLTYPAP